MHNDMKRVLIIMAFTSAFLFLNNCNKDNQSSEFPYVPINFTLNLNLPSYTDLGRPGGYVVIDNEGYKGVIVYHTIDGKYLAFDRTCTYLPLDDCSKVYVDDSGLYLHCGESEGDCCASKYDMEGNVINGPAKYPLRQYQVSQNGNMLTILN